MCSILHSENGLMTGDSRTLAQRGSGVWRGYKSCGRACVGGQEARLSVSCSAFSPASKHPDLQALRRGGRAYITTRVASVILSAHSCTKIRPPLWTLPHNILWGSWSYSAAGAGAASLDDACESKAQSRCSLPPTVIVVLRAPASVLRSSASSQQLQNFRFSLVISHH